MEKIIKVGDKEVKMRASALVPRLYRFKFGRDMIADMNKLKRAYQKAADLPEDATEEEKQDAVAQMVLMTQLSEQEVAIETLMASKGFSEAVVNLTQDSADIVVKAEELTDANRAQIEDIVTRKTEIAPENVVITPIHE